MGTFLIKRLLLLVPVVLGVVTLVFLLIHLIPGDPVDLMLGETAQQADREALRHALKLDQSLSSQFTQFLGGLTRGDLGRSLHSNRPVGSLIRERYPATLSLALSAILLAALIALPLGTLSAVRQNTIYDYGSVFFALGGVSLPSFWIGPLLILVFSIWLDLLPVSGKEAWSSFLLPSLTLALPMAAILTRMTRSSLLETLRQEYLTTARAKGVPPSRVIAKHAARNALIPLITVMGLQFGALLAGAIIVETIFSWPGLGRLTIQAIQTRDYPLVQGCVLTIALSYVLVNLLTDLVYAWVDPRIRYAREAP